VPTQVADACGFTVTAVPDPQPRPRWSLRCPNARSCRV